MTALAAALLLGAWVIKFDPASTPVANRVVAFFPREDPARWVGQSNVLINPSLPSENVFNTKVEGTNVVALSGAELTQIADYSAAQALASEKASLQQALSDQRRETRMLLEAIVRNILDQINKLRTNPTASLPAIPWTTARDAIVTDYNAAVDALEAP